MGREILSTGRGLEKLETRVRQACCDAFNEKNLLKQVVPTPMGVNRICPEPHLRLRRCPHARGGEPFPEAGSRGDVAPVYSHALLLAN
jgi:hypothetical protein